ncbi:hypothetical protein LguiB_030412 [Lonicera macranthoides]
MGNHISHQPAANGTGKVILSDGTVHEYQKPLTVAELMLDYPQEVVVEFQSSLTNGKRPCPLPADKKLETDKVYIMLPMKRGKPAALSSEEARGLLLTANNVLKSRTNDRLSGTWGFVPFIARMCIAGTRNCEGTRDFVEHKKNEQQVLIVEKTEEKRKIELLFSEIMEDRPEFLSRQLSGKSWKPNLDTIKEKGVKAKVRHWLL